MVVVAPRGVPQQSLQRPVAPLSRAMERQRRLRWKANDYYSTLNLESNATPALIKGNFRKLALKWHPDKHEEGAQRKRATDIFQQVAEAYEVLIDEGMRREYDQVWRENHANSRQAVPTFARDAGRRGSSMEPEGRSGSGLAGRGCSAEPGPRNPPGQRGPKTSATLREERQKMEERMWKNGRWREEAEEARKRQAQAERKKAEDQENERKRREECEQQDRRKRLRQRTGKRLLEEDWFEAEQFKQPEPTFVPSTSSTSKPAATSAPSAPATSAQGAASPEPKPTSWEQFLQEQVTKKWEQLTGQDLNNSLNKMTGGCAAPRPGRDSSPEQSKQRTPSPKQSKFEVRHGSAPAAFEPPARRREASPEGIAEVWVKKGATVAPAAPAAPTPLDATKEAMLMATAELANTGDALYQSARRSWGNLTEWFQRPAPQPSRSETLPARQVPSRCPRCQTVVQGRCANFCGSCRYVFT